MFLSDSSAYLFDESNRNHQVYMRSYNVDILHLAMGPNESRYSWYVWSRDDGLWVLPRNVFDAVAHLQHRRADNARILAQELA